MKRTEIEELLKNFLRFYQENYYDSEAVDVEAVLIGQYSEIGVEYLKKCQQLQEEPRHCCGEVGFDGMKGDVCPKCKEDNQPSNTAIAEEFLNSDKCPNIKELFGLNNLYFGILVEIMNEFANSKQDRWVSVEELMNFVKIYNHEYSGKDWSIHSFRVALENWMKEK